MKRKRGKKKWRKSRKKGGQRKRKVDHSIFSKDMKSIKYETYYREQKICGNDDFEDMLLYFRKTLPVTFRINSVIHPNEQIFIRNKIMNNFTHILKEKKINLTQFQIDKFEKRLNYLTQETEKNQSLIDNLKEEVEYLKKKEPFIVPPPKVLPFYPRKLAFQIDVARRELVKHPEMKELHKFLVAQTEIGNITRQEAASMLPPLLFDITSDSKILDLCAAPGSKTSQLLEILNCEGQRTQKRVTGFVVANDLDKKRCVTLKHQMERLGLGKDLLIINEDATRLPSLFPDFKFDCVLADVVCSGDGTIRKSIDIWSKWKISSGNGLNKIQIQIAKRGCELVKMGGELVYSTCSLNPVEDEAVVAEILRMFPDFELVDIGKKLPGLKYAKGLNFWRVFNNEGKEMIKEFMTDEEKTKYRTFFPPKDESEIKRMNLDKCIRILPHLSNTGGFFLAKMRRTGKTKPLRRYGCVNLDEYEIKKSDIRNVNISMGYNPLPKEKVDDIQRFYGIEKWVSDNLFYFNEKRNKTPSLFRKVTFTNESLGKVLKICQIIRSWRVVAAGSRAFEKVTQRNRVCEYRLTMEGFSDVYQGMKKRVVEMNEKTFMIILEHQGGSRIDLGRLEDKEAVKIISEYEIGPFVAKIKYTNTTMLCLRDKDGVIRQVNEKFVVKLKRTMNFTLVPGTEVKTENVLNM